MKTKEQSRNENRHSHPASTPASPSAPRHSLLRLQRAIGNQAALRYLQRKCSCGGTCSSCQSKAALPIGPANDSYEREADQTAARVMRMSNASGPVLQRKCANCEEEGQKHKLQRQDAAPGPDLAPPIVHEVLSGPGSPLDSGTRQFMEPRFGHDFAGVRVHSDTKAADSARSVGALAYTSGNNIVFGSGQYAPHSDTGRRLLAHELTHVVQQNHAPAQNKSTIRRQGPSPGQQTQPPTPSQKIDPGCAGHAAEINAAWDRAVEIVAGTLRNLETIKMAMSEQGGPRRLMPEQTRCVLTSFGDVGGLEGTEAGGAMFTLIDTIIKNFTTIQSGFTSGKTLRCDPNTVGQNECDWRDAFVVPGNSKDIFLCPQLFESYKDVVLRAVTLIHEMAHSVLRIGHQGIPERTFPATFFDYSIPLGLDFDDARRNAFAYEILANCLQGNPPSSAVPAKPKGTAATGHEPRGSISLAGGVAVTPGTATPPVQGLAGIAGRLSLRPGAMVIFNPYIGLGVLYSPTTDIQPSGFLSGLVDAGLRIQQPTRGFYLDAFGSGFVGFEAPLKAPLRFSGGVGAGLGAGYRWDRIELGAEARALFPLTQGDPDRVAVLGRLAFRIGSTK